MGKTVKKNSPNGEFFFWPIEAEKGRWGNRVFTQRGKGWTIPPNGGIVLAFFEKQEADMSIKLKVRPNDPPMTWNDFLKKCGRYSIALDGYVADSPKLDSFMPAANFNHHENVSRLETRATCAQVHLLIQLGLFKLFRDEDGPRADLYVNDCDEDVCLSVTQLRHPHIAESVINPGLNRLVDLSDKLDATAGLFPFSTDMPALEELAWVYEPYRRFRLSGGLDSRDAGAFESIITDVEHRILSFIVGKQKRIKLDTRYKVIRSGTGWAMIEEVGPYGRQGALSDGIRAFVAIRKRNNNNLACSVGRVSECIPFPVPKILNSLSLAENLVEEGWGGSSTIGGAPRKYGSKLTEDQIFEIAERETLAFLSRKAAAE